MNEIRSRFSTFHVPVSLRSSNYLFCLILSASLSVYVVADSIEAEEYAQLKWKESE